MISSELIHPMLVHFPIVLLLVLAAFDLVASIAKKPITANSVFANISVSIVVLAAISAVATYFMGGVALDTAEATGFHSDIAEMHESLGTLVALATSAYAVVRVILWKTKQSTALLNTLAVIVSLALGGLVVATAYYGGQLVYDLGVNVTKVAS